MGADPSDDHYAVLGVDADVDPAQLRRAWRKLALRWHPDRTGPGVDRSTFQRISAAYTVLSNPAARAAYDRRRGVPARDSVARAGDAATEPPTTARRRAPATMLWRLSLSLDELIACGFARRSEGDVIELLLNDQEASEGGVVTVSMNVQVRCRACVAEAGVAEAGGPCATCGTKRTVEERFSAWLSIPPGVVEGVILTPSTLLRGMVEPVSFRVRFEDAN